MMVGHVDLRKSEMPTQSVPSSYTVLICAHIQFYVKLYKFILICALLHQCALN